MLATLDLYVEKWNRSMPHGSIPHHIQKINSGSIKDIHLRPEIMSLLERNVGENYCCAGYWMISRARAAKAKWNKWDYIHLRIFRMAYETMNRAKRHPTEWERYLSGTYLTKGLISKIYQPLKKLSNKNSTIPVKKLAKNSIDSSQRRKYTWSPTYEMRSTSLTIRKMQTQTTMRYHLTPLRKVKSQKTENKCCW